METCVWPSEPRHGRLIQRASQASPWRWTPTWWQLKTPTNLEVRPLAGPRGLPHWLKLCLYCLHVSYVLIPVSYLPLMLSGSGICSHGRWLSLSFLCTRCHFFMLLPCMLTERCFGSTADICRHGRHSVTVLNVCSSASCALCFCMLLKVCDRFYCMNGHFDSFHWLWICRCNSILLSF